MKTKDKVIKLLKENRGQFLSGQEIADSIQVTRACIWKAIKSLEGQGYAIDAVTNRGYRLRQVFGEIDAVGIENAVNPVKSRFFPDLSCIKIVYESEVTSTNDVAACIVRDTGNPVLVIADSQTKGRGRRGREFFSPKGTGIYMSLALRPGKMISEVTEITAVGAVAVSKAIDDLFFDGEDVSKIKWVNDVFVNDRKVAGILTEGVSSFEDLDESYIVIGFGINVFRPENDFPKEIRNIAGSITKEIVNSTEDMGIVRSRLAAEIVRNLFHYLDERGQECIEIYRNKMFIIGNYVRINDYRTGIKYAYVIGVRDDYKLLVRYDDDSEAALSSGEVSTQKY